MKYDPDDLDTPYTKAMLPQIVERGIDRIATARTEDRRRRIERHEQIERAEAVIRAADHMIALVATADLRLADAGARRYMEARRNYRLTLDAPTVPSSTDVEDGQHAVGASPTTEVR